MSRLHAITLPSPVGPLTLVASQAGLRAVMWLQDERTRAAVGALSAAPAPADGGAVVAGLDPGGILAATIDQLQEYFAGERTEFELALDPVGTAFQRAAWTALRSIRYGETVSYGEQARRMGDVRKARAVGAANGRNPISIIVPCHRVVGADGSLTGFGGGLANKAWLLDHERSVWATTQLRLDV